MKRGYILICSLLVTCQSYAGVPENKPGPATPVIIENGAPIPVEATILNFPEASSETRQQVDDTLLSPTGSPQLRPPYRTGYIVPEGKTLIMKDLWGYNTLEDSTPHRMEMIVGELHPSNPTDCDGSVRNRLYLGIPTEGTAVINFGAAPEFVGPTDICVAALGTTGDFLIGGFSGYLIDTP